MSVTLYHYTDNTSAELIRKSGKILQSIKANDDDAVFGDGVYLTSMSPNNAKEKLAKNNFDDNDLPMIKIREGKLDSYVKVVLRKNNGKLKKLSPKSGRDIYLYKGDLILKDMEEFEIKKM